MPVEQENEEVLQGTGVSTSTDWTPAGIMRVCTSVCVTAAYGVVLK